MKARLVVEVEVAEGCDVVDLAELANTCAALLVQARDRRVEAAEAAGVERLE